MITGGLNGATRRLATGALIASLAACGGSSKYSTVKSTASYRTLVDAGAHLLKQGNLRAAEQLFAQAIAKDPSGVVAHYDLGVVYQQLGDHRNAMRQYRTARRADPQYVPALFNEAILVSHANRPLAIFYYRQIISLQADSPTAFLNLGLLENQTRPLHRQALRDLAQALRLDPSLRGQIPNALRGQLRAAG